MARLIIKLGGRKKFNRRILGSREVQSPLDRITRDIEGPARAKLAKHRDARSAHHVTAYREGFSRIVALVGPAAMSIQFGHHQKKTGKFVQGLHILPTSSKGGGEEE